MTSTHPSTGARRILRATTTALRLLFGTAGLTLVTAGIPWLLVRFVGNPDPWQHREGWGSPGQTWDNLSQPLDEDVLIRLLALVAWICWLAFVLNILGELWWYLRRLPALAADTGARAAHAAHMAELPAHRMVAAVLVGGVMLAVLAMWRTGTAAAAPAAAYQPAPRPPGIAQSATITHEHPPAVPPAAGGHTANARLVPGRTAVSGPPVPYTVVRGDTLWDIAAERLGDPLRWPQIYTLSKTLTQPDGAHLSDPDLIEPGWTLHLPADATTPTTDAEEPNEAPQEPDTAPTPSAPPAASGAPVYPHMPDVPGDSGPAAPLPSQPTTPPATGMPGDFAPTPAPDTSVPAPAAPPAPTKALPPAAPSPPPTTAAPPADAPPAAAPVPSAPGASTSPAPVAPAEDEDGGPVGINVGEAGFIGVTLAAGIAATLAFARAHRRRRHRVGDAEPPPLSGIVREAQHAHLWAHHTTPAPDDPDGDEVAHDAPSSADVAPRRPVPGVARPASTITVGVRGRRELTVWDATAGNGLGLTGPGALGVARAVAMSVATAAQRTRPDPPPARVLLTTADAAIVLPDHQPPREGGPLRIVADLDRALDEAEAHLLAHRRAAENDDTDERGPGTLILLTRADRQRLPRMRAIAAHGAGGGVAILTLGTWPGASCHVQPDGSLTRTADTLGPPVRFFHLDPEHTRDLLDLLAAAHGHTPTPPTARPRRTPPGPTAAPRPSNRPATPRRGGTSTIVVSLPTTTTELPDPPHRMPATPSSPPDAAEADAEVDDEAHARADPATGTTAAADAHTADDHEPDADTAPAPERDADADVGNGTRPQEESDGTGTGTGSARRDDGDPEAPGTDAETNSDRGGDAEGEGAPVERGAPRSSEPVVVLRVLGKFGIDAAGEPIPLGASLRSGVREFLGLLAAYPEGIRGEELADKLNTPMDPVEARREMANIRRSARKILARAGDAVGARWAVFFSRSGDRYLLAADQITSDLRILTTALDTAAHAADPAQAAAAWQRAITAYRGPYLDGSPYPFADTIRESVHHRIVDAHTRLAEHHTTTGDTDHALDLLARAITLDPTNEALHQKTMRLQLDAGHTDAAVRTLGALRRALAEIDAEPDPATLDLLAAADIPDARRAAS
ncbi:BTAD domain-containing putative transcriptional regulator [Embleya sp. NPDC020630]|uniref:BTAD domain-containing putative transcriptional regulator n=1 Tax=Embleya sp. NPDC020630 TaxID=3363979 RepID=UPI0037873D4A